MNHYGFDFQNNKKVLDQFVDAIKSDTETTKNALKLFWPYTFVNKKCFLYAVEEKKMHVAIFNALMNHKDNYSMTARLLSILREMCKSEKVALYIFESGNIYLLRSIGTDYISIAGITNTIIRIMVEIIKHKNKSVSVQICTYEDIVYIMHALQMYQKRSSAIIVSLCLYTQHQLNIKLYRCFQSKLLKLCYKTANHWMISRNVEKRSVLQSLDLIITMISLLEH
jgi:hypothetical protein